MTPLYELKGIIGASAGGLTAFEAFFSGMRTDTDPGIAFVLAQHLTPDHKNILKSISSPIWSAEVLTTNVRSLNPEELREEALAKIQQLSLAEILKPYYTQRIAKDGTIMDVSMVSTALMNEAHHIYAITTTERVKGLKIGRKKKLLR